ncbi:MAG: Rpp14/Pop5 family protein [Candidatus Syntropharchaeia archaeon]
MKGLRPSLRERKRYIGFEVISEKEIEKKELIREIFTSATSLYGDKGVSECSPWLISFDGKRGILRCSHRMTDEARNVLASIDRINGGPVGIRVLTISGTIKGVRKKIKGL